jgi:RNA 2',3'-cyclic 3'-phosphodiesterase
VNEHTFSKRLFIALPIPSVANHSLDKYCRQLDEQDESSRIRYTPVNNRHLTLVFLGQLDPTQVVDATEAVQQIQHTPISLKLTTIERFPDSQSRIITVLPEPSSQLRSLHHQLQQALEQRGFPATTRPFRPHVTLARMKYSNEHLAIALNPPIEMTASEVILYESQRIDTSNVYIPQVKMALNKSTAYG